MSSSTTTRKPLSTDEVIGELKCFFKLHFSKDQVDKLTKGAGALERLAKSIVTDAPEASPHSPIRDVYRRSGLKAGELRRLVREVLQGRHGKVWRV